MNILYRSVRVKKVRVVYRQRIMYLQFIVVSYINTDKDMKLTMPDRSAGSSGVVNSDFSGPTERVDSSWE